MIVVALPLISEAFCAQAGSRTASDPARPPSAHGIACEDLDGDGLLDLVLAGHAASGPPRLLRNRGDGAFEDRTSAAGLDAVRGGSGVIQADYDNDGDADLLVLRAEGSGAGAPPRDSLLRNRGDGSFEDVAREAGLGSEGATLDAVFADLDGDGWLDLARVRESAGGAALEIGMNGRDGRYTDVTARAGATPTGRVESIAPYDAGDDGRIDLLLGAGSSPGLLLRNEPSTGSPGFRFAVLVHDPDLDGEPDVRFDDAGIVEDLDSARDLGDVAIADLDNDGDLDVVAHAQGDHSAEDCSYELFENTGDGCRWISLLLKGVAGVPVRSNGANRAGLGARIHVRIVEDGIERSIRSLAGTTNPVGSTTLRQHIGLGRADSIAFLEIEWPGSATRQRIESPPLDRYVEVTEGCAGLRALDLPVFRLDARPIGSRR